MKRKKISGIELMRWGSGFSDLNDPVGAALELGKDVAPQKGLDSIHSCVGLVVG